ncbi:hypothetical protein Ancab_033349 [Ancistrocladus abbreviatus]
MQESIGQVKLGTKQALREQAEISAEKALELQSSKLAREEAEKKITSLLKEHDPELAQKLELKLGGTNDEIRVLEEELTQTRAAFSEYQRISNSELHAAKQELEKVEEEKRSLQNLVDSLKLELGYIGKDISEAKVREAQTQSLAQKVQAELQHCRIQLETGLANKTRTADTTDDMVSTLEQLSLETEQARQVAEELNSTVLELRQEAKTVQDNAAEMEKALSSALKEVEEAKSSERVALHENKTLSERADAALASTSQNADKKVKLSKDEYKSLRERVDESENLADMKVAAATAQVEALIASQMEAAAKLETSLKEIEDIKVATEEALKQAEMAEAAKMVIKDELDRWRREEQNIAEG